MNEASGLTSRHEKSASIAIIDYGICNVGSVKNMLRRSGYLALAVNDPRDLVNFDKIILPGVGYFKAGMENLWRGGWVEPLKRAALEEKKPVLGICLGMQLLAQYSEEGDCEGLGMLDMKVRHFDRARMPAGMPVPHMGWANVNREAEHAMTLTELSEAQRFYFVHSLHVAELGPAVKPLFICDYGYPFVAACYQENIMGVQFHPEKSHLFGQEILANFADL